MRIGFGVFLIAFGAILAYATSWHIHGLNLHTAGGILMVVGIAWVVISVVVYQQQRHGTIVTRRRRLDEDPTHPGEVVYEESSDIDRPVGNQPASLYDEVLHPGKAVSYPPPEVLEDPPSGQNDQRF
jgi:uncharacterized protein DUF6458